MMTPIQYFVMISTIFKIALAKKNCLNLELFLKPILSQMQCQYNCVESVFNFHIYLLQEYPDGCMILFRFFIIENR